MSEQELKRLIIGYLNLQGHFVWVNNSGLTRSTYIDKFGRQKERAWRAGVKGGSDILGIEKKTGRFLAIEVKVGKNKTTPQQDLFLKEIESRGGVAIIAYSIQDVQEMGL